MNKADMLKSDYYRASDDGAVFSYLPHLVPDSLLLPNCPSSILDSLADDLDLLRTDPNVVLSMHRWLLPAASNQENCVCDLAGALMIGTLNAPKSFVGLRVTLSKLQIKPCMYSPRIRAVLEGIDSFRQGDPADLVAATMTSELSNNGHIAIYKNYGDAYEARWNSTHTKDEVYWHNDIEKQYILNLITRIRWASRWIRNNHDLALIS